MENEYAEIFGYHENVVFFYHFFKKTILWLSEDFCNKNHKFVLCDERKRVCHFHKLLLKFEKIIENDLCFDKEKLWEIIDLKFFDGRHMMMQLFFIFLVQKILLISVKKMKYLKMRE